jgi:hypothetical protein
MKRSARKRWALVTVVVAAGALCVSSPAFAAWASFGSGAGKAASPSMPTGAAPTASVNGNQVTVSWPAATFPDGTPVAGYVVNRYSATGVLQTIGAGCTGVVATLMCTELSVPIGTWSYTDTPVQSNWRGHESGRSSAVQVTS